MNETCSTCKYSQPIADSRHHKRPMVCRRYPPHYPPTTDDPANTYPKVGAYDWCGEWTPQPETTTT